MTPKKVQKVNLTLTTTITTPDAVPEIYHLRTKGQVFLSPEKFYLRYQEDPQIAVTWKWQSDKQKLTIHRKAPTAQAQMIFRIAQDQVFAYHTPYGTLDLTTRTRQLQVNWQPGNAAGDLRVAYQLLDSQNSLGEYKLSLHFDL
ncbi:DUF1934 domain-containing protein [Lactobacillus sp. DCY120]|uniref:DUF1934 domain-containing protein n=1 Tax=Bombilactobacillus apium TaxID=2675299 RepID=A0A850RC20_9LACO|nr:DUF1934 domain-containing protein [Bombilactobacillus apium]NVY96338.1 DUF1934 domain-containing protein [Bombilactobacillus apium]